METHEAGRLSRDVLPLHAVRLRFRERLLEITFPGIQARRQAPLCDCRRRHRRLMTLPRRWWCPADFNIRKASRTGEDKAAVANSALQIVRISPPYNAACTPVTASRE